MKSVISTAASAALALLALACGPAFANGNSCSFSAAGNAGLNFGLLNPLTGGTVTASATMQVGSCLSGNTMLVTVSSTNQTLTGTGSAAGATIAYTITNGSFAPGTAAGPGNNTYKTVTFTGTVLQSAYADAVAGPYTGSVTVSVSP
jgi:hypothetical protein